MKEGLEGGCACGQVRYRLEREPMFVHCCHCLDCQRQTGSAFVLNALIEASEVTRLTGETHVTRMPTDSGQPHDVHRCASCQTALWSTYGGRTAVLFVRAGTLDEPSAITPDVHIFTRSKLPWVGLPAGARAYEVYYDTKALWPPGTYQRSRAALSSASA